MQIGDKVKVRFKTVRSEIIRTVRITIISQNGTFAGIYKVNGIAQMCGPVTPERVVGNEN